MTLQKYCFILLFLVFWSCSKTEVQGEMLIRKEYNGALPLEENHYIESFYDQDHKVVKRSVNKVGNGFSLPYHIPNQFTYDVQGRLIETDRSKFTYNQNGQIAAIFHKANKISRALTYEANAIFVNDQKKIILDEQKRISAVMGSLGEYKLVFHYDEKDQVVKIEKRPVVEEPHHTVEVVDVAYDVNPNPYLASFKPWIDAYAIFMFESNPELPQWWDLYVNFSKHNITSYKKRWFAFNENTKQYDVESSFKINVAVEYHYNSQGYPVKITEVNTMVDNNQNIDNTRVYHLEY